LLVNTDGAVIADEVIWKIIMNKKISASTTIVTVIIFCVLLLVGYFARKQYDVISARQTLNNFFLLLSEKQYSKAAEVYGGDREELLVFGIIGGDEKAPDSISDLLKNGCNNTLKCLKIEKVLSGKKISATEFKFTVEFLNNNGTIYKLESVGGASEEEMPAKTNFEYVVEKVAGRYLVKTMPVYDERPTQ